MTSRPATRLPGDFPTLAYDVLNLLRRHLQLLADLVRAEPIDPAQADSCFEKTIVGPRRNLPRWPR